MYPYLERQPPCRLDEPANLGQCSATTAISHTQAVDIQADLATAFINQFPNQRRQVRGRGIVERAREANGDRRTAAINPDFEGNIIPPSQGRSVRQENCCAHGLDRPAFTDDFGLALNLPARTTPSNWYDRPIHSKFGWSHRPRFSIAIDFSVRSQSRPGCSRYPSWSIELGSARGIGPNSAYCTGHVRDLVVSPVASRGTAVAVQSGLMALLTLARMVHRVQHQPRAGGMRSLARWQERRSVGMTDAASTEGPSPGMQDLAERLESALTECRARIDKLIVQADLANIDLRDELYKRLNAVGNAGLAACAGLGSARQDLASGLPAPRDTVCAVLHDLQRAVQGAREALDRR